MPKSTLAEANEKRIGLLIETSIRESKVMDKKLLWQMPTIFWIKAM